MDVLACGCDHHLHKQHRHRQAATTTTLLWAAAAGAESGGSWLGVRGGAVSTTTSSSTTDSAAAVVVGGGSRGRRRHSRGTCGLPSRWCRVSLVRYVCIDKYMGVGGRLFVCLSACLSEDRWRLFPACARALTAVTPLSTIPVVRPVPAGRHVLSVLTHTHTPFSHNTQAPARRRC